MHEYEEFHEWSTGWSWAFIIFLSGSLFTICMIVMALVMDVPRKWDYGNLDFTPSASEYSLVKPVYNDSTMILPLPEGKTMEESLK
jgi:hypothetical protein